jgi:phosphate-selective porin
MRRTLSALGFSVVLAGAFAPLAAAEGEGLEDALGDLRRRIEEQDRRIRELEGSAMTADEVAASVDRYLAGAPAVVLVGGADAKGSAGFPKGKRPFIKEGPNRLEFGFRLQGRSQAFLYGDDARASATEEGEPKDRSGFEVETLLVDLQGSVFCEDVTFRCMLNFDSDSGSGVEKRWMYVDWRYAADHHVRAGQQKVVFGYEENASAASLMFVDRNLVARAFGLNYDTGVALWGTFGDACEPKRFRYAVQASNGEGRADLVGSVFADATDRTSDQLLFAAMFEWNVTGKDWSWDEVDHRPCEERCRFDLSVGLSGHYENDDDANLPSGVAGSLAVRGNGGVGPLVRWGANAWVRARWNGFSFQSEVYRRHVDFGEDGVPDQVDDGAYAQLHYRFAESHWGVGAKYAVIWADEDHFGGVLEDTFWEAGAVLNRFFWDHSHKLSLDATYVEGNSGVSSSGPGHLVNAARGVVVEEGWLLRLQWQLNL